MMSVVRYNTAHELISKVNKLELYKVLKNRYGRGFHVITTVLIEYFV